MRASLRFVRDIIKHDPGRYLAATCVLDMQADIFLHDHTLGRDIAKLDAKQLALPIVPMTVSMEIVAQSANYLFPDLVITGMRDLRAYHWVLLEQEKVELELEATYLEADSGPDDTVAVEVSMRVRGAAGARTQPALVGTMLLAPARPAPPVATPLTLHDARPSQWTPAETYRTGMFHGPSFQAITEVTQCGRDGAIATMAAPVPDRFFRTDPDATFVAEPVLLDAAGQLIGLWTLESLESGFVVFPYRCDAVAFYGPPLQPGERVTCAAKIDLPAGNRVVSDIELVDQQGGLRVKLFGWEDRRFHIPRELYQFILKPGEHHLSQSWHAPLDMPHDALPAVMPYCCRRIGEWGEWGSHFEFWSMVIAYLLFSPRERRVWQARNDPAPRRRDWLLGRVAAKEAVVALVREHFGLQLAPADVEIIADDAGRPTVVGSWLTALGAAINLSISHSQGMVVALAGIVISESALGVGIDVEPTTRDATQFADVAFTPEERVLLRALENRSLDEAEDDWALRLWCAKEAVGKALGCGLSYGPHSIVATHIERATGVIRLCIRGALSTHLPFFAEETFHAFTTQDEAWVVATVLDQLTRQPSRVEHDALSMICPVT